MAHELFKLIIQFSLFNGGALDSQLTDSQYIHNISGEGAHT